MDAVAWGAVDVDMVRANGVHEDFWADLKAVGRGLRVQHAVQRAGNACGRNDNLVNGGVTPRMGADIRVAAMPGGLVRKSMSRRSSRRFTAKGRARYISRSSQFMSDAIPPPRRLHIIVPRPQLPTMASVPPSVRQFSACLRCVRQLPTANGAPRRFLSSSTAAREELNTQSSTSPPSAAPPAPSNPPSGAAESAPAQNTPEYMQKWGTLDPQMVENKKQERRLLRREHVQPVGSRRRRATLRRSAMQQAPEVPFEQLPYQCFQEARKVLLEDRQEKIREIETQQLRIKNLTTQDPAVSGGPLAKAARLRSMKKHLNELIILADINDPVVKRKFEDGQGKLLS